MLEVELVLDRGSDGRQGAAACGGGLLKDDELRRRVPKVVDSPKTGQVAGLGPTLRYRNTAIG